MSKKKPSNLIIRLSSMGDVALTMPVLDYLLTHNGPSCTDYITKKAFKPLIEHHPAVHHVYILDEDLSIEKLRRIIRKNKYATILDLHKNLRSYLLTLGFRHVHRIKKELIKRFLLSKFKIYKPPYPHVTQKYLKTLGVHENVIPSSSLYIPSEEEIRPENRDHYTQWKSGIRNLILAPGASKPSKMLPLETWEKVLKDISREWDNILITGNGETETAWAEKISQENRFLMNMTNRLTLRELMLFIKGGTLFAGNDSGPAHLAALCGIKTIVIFGQTVPDYGFAPLNSPSLIEPPIHLVCRPCSHLGFDRCPEKHHLCMRSIDAQTLINEIRYLLLEKST
jgi:ADP-heptose:LPS heptosyltransferase